MYPLSEKVVSNALFLRKKSCLYKKIRKKCIRNCVRVKDRASAMDGSRSYPKPHSGKGGGDFEITEVV